MSRLIGVVPAAGYGTRLGLATGSKELVDIGGTPVIEYLLRRLEVGGCNEIRLVTRPDKRDLVDFGRARGLSIVLAAPAHVGASIAEGLRGLDDDDRIAVGFPDTIWQPPDGFVKLCSALDQGAEVALGLFRTADAARSDVVDLDDDGWVRQIFVEPPEPPSDLIYGCYVATKAALTGIESAVEPSTLLAELRGRVRGVFLSSAWIDVGTPSGLAAARVRWGSGDSASAGASLGGRPR